MQQICFVDRLNSILKTKRYKDIKEINYKKTFYSNIIHGKKEKNYLKSLYINKNKRKKIIKEEKRKEKIIKEKKYRKNIARADKKRNLLYIIEYQDMCKYI